MKESYIIIQSLLFKREQRLGSKKDKKENLDQLRLDRWLNVSGLFKTRTKAATFCQARHVKVNGKTAKPSQLLKIGDNISIQFPRRNRTFDVLGFAPRPIPVAKARELYLEHLPKISEESSELYQLFMRQDRIRQKELRGQGRPTKKERRNIGKIKGK